VPDHSTFSKNRHGRFRDSGLLRKLFQDTVAPCIAEGLVGGEAFAVDASMIKADANRQRSTPGDDWRPPDDPGRAVREYLSVLDDTAFGAATSVTPKFVSTADPASRWTGANGGLAFFAYSDNYLIDLQHAVIVDVEATTSVRQAEVGAGRTMLDRTRERFGLKPQRLAADAGYGDAANLAWLVEERGIEPHIPVFEKIAPTVASGELTSVTVMRPTATPARADVNSGATGRTAARPRRGRLLTGSTGTAPARPTAMTAVCDRAAVPGRPEGSCCARSMSMRAT
jgi:hypothetical protein